MFGKKVFVNVKAKNIFKYDFFLNLFLCLKNA